MLTASGSPWRLLGHAAVTACVLVGCAGTGTAGAQSPCADLGGTVDSHQTCHVHNTSSVYTVNFDFPVSYPDQRALTDYLADDRDRFVTHVTQLPPRNDVSYELDAQGTTYRSGTPAAGTESVVLEVYSDSGGAHPVTLYKAFTYDLSKHVPISFATLFKPGTNPQATLDPIVQRELESRGHPITQPFNVLGTESYQNFAITDDAVIFFFGQGVLLAEVDGPLEVSVPRTALAALLA
jgi:Protein of unknown function (DUF3298)